MTDDRPPLDAVTDSLFPRSPAERLNCLATFVRAERAIRAQMLQRHQGEREKWQAKVAAADEALHHIEQLRRELA